MISSENILKNQLRQKGAQAFYRTLTDELWLKWTSQELQASKSKLVSVPSFVVEFWPMQQGLLLSRVEKDWSHCWISKKKYPCVRHIGSDLIWRTWASNLSLKSWDMKMCTSNIWWCYEIADFQIWARNCGYIFVTLFLSETHSEILPREELRLW